MFPCAALLPKLCPKFLSKAAPQSSAQSCSPKLLRKAAPKVVAENCFPKLLLKLLPKGSKGASQSWGSSKLPCKVVPQSCSPKLFPGDVPKVVPKAVLQNYCPKAAIQQTYYQNVSPKPLCKAAPESYAPKLPTCPRKLFPKAASQSCFLKLHPKVVVLQSNCPSMLLQSRKVAPHNCSPIAQIYFPKYLYKAIAPNRLCFKPLPQSYSPKRLPKAASQSCPTKLRFFKAAAQSCSSKLLPKAAPQSCSLRCAAPQSFAQSYSPKLRKASPQSCCRKLLPKIAF